MNLRQAAQQALEFCEFLWREVLLNDWAEGQREALEKALMQALAEPEQEPVAWMYHGIRHDGTLHDRPSLIWRPEHMDAMSADKGAKAIPLYTAPTPRKPLTDEEIQTIWAKTFEMGSSANTFARAIERAHGIGGGE